METTTPVVDTAERPVDTFEPSSDTTAPSGGAVRFEGDDFYDVPEPLPADEAGTLLRYEPIDVFGGWSNLGDSPGEFGLQTMGTISGEVVMWRDPVAVRPERVDRPVPDEAVGRSAQELASPGSPSTPTSTRATRSRSRSAAWTGSRWRSPSRRTSTNTPVLCPSEEVCVDLFAPPHLGFAWRLVTRRRPRPDDPARHRRRRRHGAHRRRPLRPSRHRSGGVRHAGRAAAGQHRLHRRRARTGHRRVCGAASDPAVARCNRVGTRPPSSNHRSATRFPHARPAGPPPGG